jgi:hypothetical protein
VNQQQQLPWRPTRKQVLWTLGIIVALVGAYIFLRFAYVREGKWTGLVKNANYHKRTLWDWLDLLIVPVVLAIGGCSPDLRAGERRTSPTSRGTWIAK